MTDDYDDCQPASIPCPKHGHVRLMRSCWSCGGEGFHDELHFVDPLWYDEDDTEVCDICRGKGWLEWCPRCAEEEKAA